MAAQDQDEAATAGGRATLASFLKHEITRLSRKVLRAEIEPLRKAVTHHRGQSAEFKRKIASLEKEIAELRRAEKRRSVAEPVNEDEGPKRWMPKGLASHRAKLGLSAGDYARLVGVSGLSIYKWEQGKNTPRRAQQIALAKVRSLGKREARARLDELGVERTGRSARRARKTPVAKTAGDAASPEIGRVRVVGVAVLGEVPAPSGVSEIRKFIAAP